MTTPPRGWRQRPPAPAGSADAAPAPDRRWLGNDQRARPVWRRFGAGIFFVVCAALISEVLHPFLAPAPLAPFVAAAALSAWYGGAGPAILAIVLSLAPISLFVLEPVHALTLSADDQTALLIFVLVTTLLVLLSASRDRAEHALREREALLRETAAYLDFTFAAFGAADYDVDLRGGKIAPSPRLNALFGFPADYPLTVADCETRYHPEDRGVLAEIAARAEREGELAFQRELRLVLPDGTIRWALTRGLVVLDARGRAARARGAAIDITAQKTAEQDRVAFVDAATHDLKNPLTSLKGRTQLLLRKVRRSQPPAGAELAAELTGIDRDASRMAVLIDELMDAARLRAGQQLTLDLAPTDLVAIAEAGAADARRRASLPISVEASETTLVGHWDRPRLERVVQNLLDNAVKYSPAGGRIVVRVAREPGPGGTAWATLAVRDEGLGIPAADLPSIFERFHRGSNVGDRTGTGIGLAGVKQIVEQHGGTIAVESVEGCGSTFTLRLPLEPPAHEPKVAKGA